MRLLFRSVRTDPKRGTTSCREPKPRGAARASDEVAHRPTLPSHEYRSPMPVIRYVQASALQQNAIDRDCPDDCRVVVIARGVRRSRPARRSVGKEEEE